MTNLAAGRVQQRIHLQLEYPVVFTENAFAPGNPTLRDVVARLEHGRRHRCFFVLDAGVAAAWPELLAAVRQYVLTHAGSLELVGEALIVPGGESTKNDAQGVERVHRAVHEYKLDRHAVIVAIGGGAVLDMVGYAAATAHRGIRLVRLPTTVLAQDDSGIGVKNGVNAFGKKNFLGCFQAPFGVICDAAFLTTLSDRDRRAGMAEAVKVALIRDDAFFSWLERNAARLARFESGALNWLVEHCARLHLDHIRSSGDPFELGSARPLDFGHWAAHKLESLADFELRHGEAVAIGIAIDTCYSVKSGWLSQADGNRVCHLLDTLGLPTWHPLLATLGPEGLPQVLAGLEEFREHLGGELTLTMLEEIGRGFEIHHVDADLLQACLKHLEQRRRHQPAPATGLHP